MQPPFSILIVLKMVSAATRFKRAMSAMPTRSQRPCAVAKTARQFNKCQPVHRPAQTFARKRHDCAGTDAHGRVALGPQRPERSAARLFCRTKSRRRHVHAGARHVDRWRSAATGAPRIVPSQRKRQSAVLNQRRLERMLAQTLGAVDTVGWGSAFRNFAECIRRTGIRCLPTISHTCCCTMTCSPCGPICTSI